MYAWSELHRYVMHGVDGDVGRVEDVYFDDRHWVVRDLVIDSRHWLRGRRVLIPPAAVHAVDGVHRRLEVGLTRADVEHSPSIDTAKPVFRQHHVDLYSYFGFPFDWSGPAVRRDALAGIGGGDLHLRSARAMIGYRVQAKPGELGLVDDFLVEMGSWGIGYVVVQPADGESDGPLLVPAEWVIGVSWERRLLDVSLAQDALQTASPPDCARSPDRERGAHAQR